MVDPGIVAEDGRGGGGDPGRAEGRVALGEGAAVVGPGVSVPFPPQADATARAANNSRCQLLPGSTLMTPS